MLNWLSRKGEQTQQPPVPPGSDNISMELPFSGEQSRGVAVPNRLKILRQLHGSCSRQLEVLLQSLKLSSAVLLWIDPRAQSMRLYAAASSAGALDPGPYPVGLGMTGLLKDRQLITLAPFGPHSPPLPYYPADFAVGSCLAVKLPLPEQGSSLGNDRAILIIDRTDPSAWSDSEINQVQLAAEQLAGAVAMARQLFVYDRERHGYRRAFDGLRKLNTALGLESTYEATAAAVRTIVPADFLAISLVDAGRHRIAYLQGDKAELLADQAFSVEQGLVGQVIKYRRTLPDNAEYSGHSPVFSEEHLFADYRSLLVVPLYQEDVSAIGALVVAAKEPEMFTRTCREMLELVATQVTIKIGLAQAHEQINRMATLDTLTGIANRRAYQRGFAVMLERAKRRPGSLHLILCDIDHFKRVNDSFGHPVGDMVLQQVAKLMDRVVRSGDLAARTGGEEFAILLEDTDTAGAWKVAERLRELVAGQVICPAGQEVRVTLSLGIAVYPQNGDSVEQLVSCADKALYQAKHNGRNQTILWESTRPAANIESSLP